MDPVPKQDVFKYILASDFGSSVLKKVDTFKTIYSNKTFDYMACKRPIFMVIDGVSRKLVEDAQCGVYVEPENPAEYEEQIRFMLDNSDGELSQMGESGYHFAKSNFDREVLADRYVKHIEELLNGK